MPQKVKSTEKKEALAAEAAHFQMTDTLIFVLCTPQKVKSTDKKEALAAEAARIDGQLREDAARQKRLKFEQSLKVGS
jgi:hypothetical protein